MITLKQLSFHYENYKNLFENMELNIPNGGICGLLGKNGSGKTTLLKIISGLVFPTGGSCRVLEHNPSARQPGFLQDIYYLPEDLYVPALSVETYLNFYASFYPRFDQAMLQNYLKEFELPQDKLLSTFSHGQKKKFLIAFGLATHSRILLLDEPTNGLDIPSKTQFRKLLAATITDEKLFIISTHQVHDVENLIDSIVVLDEGKIIFHEDLLRITQALAFTQQAIEPAASNCIYSEKQLGGYHTISENIKGLDTEINLETLFNAILTQKQKIQAIFSEDKQS